jgi:hypothetical protein
LIYDPISEKNTPKLKPSGKKDEVKVIDMNSKEILNMKKTI